VLSLLEAANTDAAWIGGTRDNASGTFKWPGAARDCLTDGGGPDHYQNWNEGEPNNDGGNEDCMWMKKSDGANNGKWYDGPCTGGSRVYKKFVCQDIEASPAPPPTPPPPQQPTKTLTERDLDVTGGACYELYLSTVVTATGSSSDAATLALSVSDEASMGGVEHLPSGVTCESDAADRAADPSYASKLTCTSPSTDDMLEAIRSMSLRVCPACFDDHLVLSVDLSSGAEGIRHVSAATYSTGAVEVPLHAPVDPSAARTVLGRALPREALEVVGAPWCNRGAVTAAVGVSVEYDANALAFYGGKCTHAFASNTAVDSATGRFALQVNVPPASGAEAALTITTGEHHSTTVYLESNTGSWDQAHLQLLPPVWLVPSAEAISQWTIKGTVSAVNASASAVAAFQAAVSGQVVKVSAYIGVDNPGDGSDVISSTVSADGSFTLVTSNFDHVGGPSAMATLIVTTTEPGLVLAGTTATVMYDSVDVNLDVLVSQHFVCAGSDCMSASDMGTFAVLTHSGTVDDINLGLQYVSSAQGQPHFSVSASPVSSSGGMSWAETSSGSSEVISFDASSWVTNARYDLYAPYKQKKCDGYQATEGINCIGECETGAGYCYSSADGQTCVQCHLHSAGAGDVLCTDHGQPQGLVENLPGGSAFTPQCEASWTNDGGPQAWTRPCSGRGMASSPVLRLFSKGLLVQRVPLLSLLQEDAGGSRAMWFMCIQAQACAAGCDDYIESVSKLKPVVMINSRPGLTDAQYDDFQAGTLPAADQCDTRALSNTQAECNELVCVRDAAFFTS